MKICSKCGTEKPLSERPDRSRTVYRAAFVTFVDFARGFGLDVDRPIADGRWHRTKTTDHPHKRNGAYAFWGDRGAAQNWATMESVAVWRENGSPQHGANARAVIQSAQDDRKRHLAARKQAATLLAECERAKHPYLGRKGFPEALGLVHPCGDLLIPMRDCQHYDVINSVQRIDQDGNKKFLHGGKAKGSVFRLGSRGPTWLVEGYATGLSVQMAIADLRQTARVLVCFSASNLTYAARFVKSPAFVFADCDESGAGLKAAESTRFPWCMGPAGMDANDVHREHGLRRVVMLMIEAQSMERAA